MVGNVLQTAIPFKFINGSSYIQYPLPGYRGDPSLFYKVVQLPTGGNLFEDDGVQPVFDFGKICKSNLFLISSIYSVHSTSVIYQPTAIWATNDSFSYTISDYQLSYHRVDMIFINTPPPTVPPTTTPAPIPNTTLPATTPIGTLFLKSSQSPRN